MKKLFMLIVLLLSLGMIGCTSNGEDKLQNFEEKKTLSIGVVSFADTLEPTDQYFSWVVMRYAIGETLVKFSETMSATPWLAKEWYLDNDKLTWHFKIRDGVKFSNGNLLTTDSIKNSLERTFERSKRASADFFQYDYIETTEDEIIIKTKTPIPGLPGCLADPLFIIVDTSVDTEKFAMDGPVCTGPYVNKIFDKERCLVIKNQYYWDGEVPFDEINLIAIDDVSTRSMSLQAGEIDIAVNIASGDLPLFENENFDINEIVSLRTVLSFMNQKGVLQDIRIRQAIIRALDRDTYADILLNGTFLAGKAPIPPSLEYDFENLIDINKYNIESAKQLLAEAGYTEYDSDGYVYKDGEKLSLRYIIYDSREELPLLAEATQVNLKEIGIEVKIENYEYTTLLNMQESGDYDLLIWNVLTANTGDPENYLKEYWKSHTAENQNANTFGYSNSKLDDILELLSKEFDSDKRKQYIIDAQQIIMNDAATIFYVYPETNIISSKNVTGVKMLPSDYYWLTKDIKPLN